MLEIDPLACCLLRYCRALHSVCANGTIPSPSQPPTHPPMHPHLPQRLCFHTHRQFVVNSFINGLTQRNSTSLTATPPVPPVFLHTLLLLVYVLCLLTHTNTQGVALWPTGSSAA